MPAAKKEDIEMTVPDIGASDGANAEERVEHKERTCGEIFYREEKGLTLYLNNTCENWGRILSCVFALYTFVGLLFWALLEASIAYGKPVLFTFFVLFIFFSFTVAAAVAVGHVDRLKAEREAREAAVGVADE